MVVVIKKPKGCSKVITKDRKSQRGPSVCRGGQVILDCTICWDVGFIWYFKSSGLYLKYVCLQ